MSRVAAVPFLFVRSILGALAIADCLAQGVPVATGTVQGSVVSGTGVAVAKATVFVYPLDPLSRFTANTLTTAAGSFSIAAVPAGRYVLCARPATSNLADSCTWGITRLIVEVPVPAGAAPISIHLKAASVLKVRINDTGGYLERRPTDKAGPHVLVGVLSLGKFVPAVVSGQDKTGIDYSLRVPSDTPLPLRVYSMNVKLQDSANAVVASQGYSSVIVQSSANPVSPPMVFSAVGRLP
jgi:Carboxypeptidase regulatory-like domain